MPTRKEACIARLEEWILSGELKVDQRLPPERDLAASWSISRPVLHEAIVDLQAKGLVRIVPRHGVYVKDFRTNGSIAMLASLISYSGNSFEPAFVQSLIDLRTMLECETSRMAAIHRTDAQAEALLSLADELNFTQSQARLVKIVFEFNHLVALASQNLIYPLITNSFKAVYNNFASKFLSRYGSEDTIEWIRSMYHRVALAIQDHDSDTASRLTRELIAASEVLYKKM
jgi:GntR family transcriptional regulator, transcriptional repressor for pyruvate dehydrogenase complex